MEKKTYPYKIAAQCDDWHSVDTLIPETQQSIILIISYHSYYRRINSTT